MADDSHSYSVSIVFILQDGYSCSETMRRVMWLFSTVVERIHAVELQERASSVTRLCGLDLLPSDVRPHHIYYHSEEACAERLEHDVYRFLLDLTTDPKLGPLLATADMWSYDWTMGDFVCLSRHFRIVHPDAAEQIKVSVGNQVYTLGQAYEMAFASDEGDIRRPSLKPRKRGKTSFILTAGRALIVEDPKAPNTTVCMRHTELDIGTFLGLPIVLTDYQNDRRIHSVLYVRFRKVVQNPSWLVARVAKIAGRRSGIQVRLEPAMTLSPGAKEELEIQNVMHEPDRVLMVGSGPAQDSEPFSG